MKLKFVVAAICLLGCVSFNAIAATPTINQTNHKKNTKEDKSLSEPVATTEKLKDAGALPPACVLSPEVLTLQALTQNNGRAMPNPCHLNWFHHISFAGGINVDGGKWGTRNANFMGENYQRLALNDVYLNMLATFTHWLQAFASVSFNDATTRGNPDSFKIFGASEYSAAYSNNINEGASRKIQVEQAFATLGDFDVFPVYVQVGKQFQDFSRYEIHPITYSLTQSLSEILATSAKLGLLTHGFNGSVAVFDNPINKIGSSHSRTNYIVALGYTVPDPHWGWDVGIDYLYNMMGVNGIAYQVVNFTTLAGSLFENGFYHHRVDALALHGDVNAGPFTLGARYTTALKRFSVLDLPLHGVADLFGDSIFGLPLPGTSGAKPWAAGLETSYSYLLWDLNQHIVVGYQTSRQAAALNLPKHRWLVGYGIDVWRHTNLALEWDHDIAYKFSNGGIGKTTNLVTLRAGLSFS